MADILATTLPGALVEMDQALAIRAEDESQVGIFGSGS